MELLWIIAAGVVFLPFYLLYSFLGAQSRIRDLEQAAREMRRAIDLLVRQQWDARRDAGAAPRPEAQPPAQPAGHAGRFDEDAVQDSPETMPADGIAAGPPIPTPPGTPEASPLEADPLPAKPAAAGPAAELPA